MRHKAALLCLCSLLWTYQSKALETLCSCTRIRRRKKQHRLLFDSCLMQRVFDSPPWRCLSWAPSPRGSAKTLPEVDVWLVIQSPPTTRSHPGDSSGFRGVISASRCVMQTDLSTRYDSLNNRNANPAYPVYDDCIKGATFSSCYHLPLQEPWRSSFATTFAFLHLIWDTCLTTDELFKQVLS